LKRGDIVTVSAPGDYGKPRPAIVIQSDRLQYTESVLVSLLTSTIVEASFFRLSLNPTPSNGLKVSSQIMIDKILAIPRDKCGAVIGKIDDKSQSALNNLLSVVIGLAD
jgi:mRNA interferase MazF